MINPKVNGKSEQIKLKEAIAGTQFSKANDEKARTLAEERKSFESRGNRLQGVRVPLAECSGNGADARASSCSLSTTTSTGMFSRPPDPARYLVTATGVPTATA